MKFKDRKDAAMRLVPILEKYKNEKSIVFAVPRGGVPIAYYIAKKYRMPLELLMTKKISHPLNDEVAIGSVTMEDYVIEKLFEIPESQIEKKVRAIRETLKERYKHFMGDRKPLGIKNKTVIIVDDGVATGHTILAAINLMWSKKPHKIVVAIPVAPRKTAERIQNQVDDFICLNVADDFYGVGQYYTDFTQVSDEEVEKLLKDVNNHSSASN